MHAAHEPDELLMAQVASGQRERLEPLVRRHAGPLASFLSRMVRDRHRCEELFQDVFLAVWVKRHQYRFPRPFKPWLYAIALNRCRAAFRGAGREPVPLEHDPPLPSCSPADTVIATETTALVKHAVGRLPPQQRAVVALRVWDGMDYADIGRAVGCSEATARSHMHHGLATMRQALKAHYP
jgi:RNA polymerase sigma-70 factor (ECF subfamily)